MGLPFLGERALVTANGKLTRAFFSCRPLTPP